MNKFILFCILVFALSLRCVFAQSIADDWDPSEKIPEVQFARSVSETEKNVAQLLREHLVEMLSYWKTRGLSEPAAIDQILYVSSLEGFGVRDFVQLLNPNIPNVLEYVRQKTNWLREKLMEAEQTKKLSAKDEAYVSDLIRRLVGSKLGCSIENLYGHLLKNTPLTQIENEILPTHDNAYYFLSVRAELEEIWDPSRPRTIDFEKLGQNIAYKIVILPRTSQTEGDVEVSTLYDFSVVAHEFGHHLVSNTSMLGANLGKVVDEVFADYFAASPFQVSQIGEFFSKVSGVVSGRLFLESNSDSRKRKMAKSLLRRSKKGFLRDLNEFWTVDDLRRKYHNSDYYESGNPLRKALWDLRQLEKSKGKLAQFESLILESLFDYSSSPLSTSIVMQLWLDVRSAIQDSKQGLEDAAFELAHDLFPAKKAEEKLDRFEDFINNRRTQNEQKDIAKRRASPVSSPKARPANAADYVLPDFFRHLYRIANAKDALLARDIRFAGEAAMNARAIEIPTQAGTVEIIFVRNPSVVTGLVHKKLQEILSNLEIHRSVLKGAFTVQSVGGSFLQTLVSSASFYTYQQSLFKLQEFERTGSVTPLNLSDQVVSSPLRALMLAKKVSSCWRLLSGLVTY